MTIRNGEYVATNSPRWFITLLAVRMRPRPGLLVLRVSITSHST
ncbi:hypothetical protein D9X30_4562 (plasmid) [Cupriavidus sp. U2]|nr:hypothetical protein D9X30_4562 [Cupriavidus sp. U2]